MDGFRIMDWDTRLISWKDISSLANACSLAMENCLLISSSINWMLDRYTIQPAKAKASVTIHESSTISLILKLLFILRAI
ncbi:hypothetical protein D3C81_2114160 [compost metagenome]